MVFPGGNSYYLLCWPGPGIDCSDPALVFDILRQGRGTLAFWHQRCAAFDAKFCYGQVDCAAVGTDNQAIATLQAKLCVGWVECLTVWAAHMYVSRLIYGDLNKF